MDDLWTRLAGHQAVDLAIVEARTGQSVRYGELIERVDALAAMLTSPSPGLVLIAAEQSIDVVVALLASWRAGHAVFPYRAPSPESFEVARRAYRAAWSIAPSRTQGADPGLATLDGALEAFAWPDPVRVDPELALLLSTSGSMSSPRTARISRSNLAASLAHIRACLAPRAGDRMLLALPIGHVYGLTSLLSHLQAGATTVLERASVLDPRFGAAVAHYEITTLPGVSFMFDALRATAWRDGPPATLRTLTHSGDRLSEPSLAWAKDLQRAKGTSFYRMYGMTETSGRIAVLPPEALFDYPASVGKLVPGGAVRFENGEIIFSGPNAAHGYAAGAEDLTTLPPAREIHTGDLGWRDAEGFLYLTGRRSRFAKLLGQRVGLDELEVALAPVAEVAAVAGENEVLIYSPHWDEPALSARLDQVARTLALPRPRLVARFIEAIPRTSTGKILYAQLREAGERP